MKLLQNFSPGIQKINKNGETENEKKVCCIYTVKRGKEGLAFNHLADCL